MTGFDFIKQYIPEATEEVLAILDKIEYGAGCSLSDLVRHRNRYGLANEEQSQWHQACRMLLFLGMTEGWLISDLTDVDYRAHHNLGDVRNHYTQEAFQAIILQLTDDKEFTDYVVSWMRDAGAEFKNE